jgi:hypothetical protein
MIHDIINSILVLILLFEIYIFVQRHYIKTQDNFDNIDSQNIEKFQSFFENIFRKIFNDKITTNSAKELVDESLPWLDKRVYLRDRDEATIYDPRYPPERRIESRQYPYPNHSFYIRTRGEPDDYQLLGLLYNTDINKNYQLYGRQTYPGSPQWEYYIRWRDAGGMELKYPLSNKDEIIDGSTLTVPIDNNTYNVTIYNFDQPRYNPFVI